jgi:hypothetical protein
MQLMRTVCFLTLLANCSAFSWAVCLTGQARSITHELIVANARARLLQSLPEATSVDAFAVLSSEDEAKQPVLLKLWPELEGRLLFYVSPPFAGKSLHENGPGFYNQWAKIEACLRMVEAHEAIVGRRFDFFVRARSDLYYYVPVNHWLSASHSTVQVGAGLGCTPSDHFGAMPRHLAGLYAGAGKIAFDPTATSAAISAVAESSLCHCSGGGLLHPECLIAAWLRLHNVPFHIACSTQFGLWRHTRSDENGELHDFGPHVYKNATTGLVEPRDACSIVPVLSTR